MEMLIAFVTLLLGLAVGAFIVWFAKEGQLQPAIQAAQAEHLAKIAGLEEKVSAGEARETELNTQLSAARKEMDQRRVRSEDELTLLRQENGSLREELSRAQVSLATERELSSEKQRLLEDLEQRFITTIENMSSRVLDNNNDAFIEKAREVLKDLPVFPAQAAAPATVPEALMASESAELVPPVLGASAEDVQSAVRPLDEMLRKVEERLADMERERADAYQNLLDRVRELGESQSALRTEAGRLASVMRAPVQRGLWGEIQLRRVVEMAGMLEYCDFETATGRNAENPAAVPDMLVRLPGSRIIEVNAKVPVNPYLDGLAVDDEATRNERMREHAAAVRAHIELLSTEAAEATDAAPDFAVAFLPGEAFLSAALAQDPSLLEFGMNQRVLLTTPTTLVSLLKTASYGWRQERVAENARQISELGKEMYDRLRVLTGHFNGIKRGLETTLRAYNDAAGSMESKILTTARRFKDLGAANGHLLDSPEFVELSPKEIHMPELRALVGAPSANGESN